METWPKMYRQVYFIVDRNEFTVELQRKTHDCLWVRGFPLWLGSAILFLPSFSHTFMHSRGSRKQQRDSHKKRAIVHRVYHFPRFFASQLLSPAGASSFFEVTTHPVRRISSCGYLMGRAEGRREKTLHYNYSIKKFKSLNIARHATIQTTLKVQGARTRLCKRGGTSRVTTRYLMHKHATKARYSVIFRSVIAVT